ncbi:hypothetical protein B0H67DRAFT_607817 [Lasiosphaeris hirsuta]|uniref:Uncharacterized protein n=1 Tax=Lasiosphaeris hirsuta TaxID=260670 RepID=A0AA40B140_9PEZI|nr:hypothetical protein B0H67DRAFT_607817 [Lasiosphaeris hirsuta]
MNLSTGEPTLLGIFEAALQQSMQQVSSRHNIDVDMMIDIMGTTLTAGQSGLASVGIDPRSPAVPGGRLHPTSGTTYGDDDSGDEHGGNSDDDAGSLVRCTLRDIADPTAPCTKEFRSEGACRDHRHTFHHVFAADEPNADKGRSASAAWLHRINAKTLGHRILAERHLVNQIKERCQHYRGRLDGLGIEYPALEGLDPQLKRTDGDAILGLYKDQLIAELIITRQEWLAWEAVDGDLVHLINENEDSDEMDLDWLV